MKAACTNCASVDTSVWHYRFAVALFVLIALVAWFCNKDSLRELEKEQTADEDALKKELDSVKGGHQRKEELERKLLALQEEQARIESLLKTELDSVKGDPQREEELKKKLLDLQKEHQRFHPDRFRRLYHLFGALMILAPAAAVGMAYFAGIYDWKVFFIEWMGIWVFAFYWLVKSYELRRSRADEKAAMGEMTVTDPAAQVTETVRQASDKVLAKVSAKYADLMK